MMVARLGLDVLIKSVIYIKAHPKHSDKNCGTVSSTSIVRIPPQYVCAETIGSFLKSMHSSSSDHCEAEIINPIEMEIGKTP